MLLERMSCLLSDKKKIVYMFYYRKQDAAIQLGTPEIFRRLTAAEWIDEMILTTTIEESELFERVPADFQLQHFLIPAYNLYRKKAPKLLIQEGNAIGQHSLYALEAIPKGAVVTEYLGEWAPQSLAPSCYRWGPIDGLHYRNLGGMVEDGFPNIAAFHFYNVQNVPLRVVFVALEGIAVGDAIAVNYGMNHSVKMHERIEYRLEAMKSFFLRYPIEKILHRIKQLQVKSMRDLGWKRTLELENLTAKIRYLFQTPSALSHLLQEKVVDPLKAFALLKEPACRYYLLGFPLNPNPRQQQVIDSLSSLEKNC